MADRRGTSFFWHVQQLSVHSADDLRDFMRIGASKLQVDFAVVDVKTPSRRQPRHLPCNVV